MLDGEQRVLASRIHELIADMRRQWVALDERIKAFDAAKAEFATLRLRLLKVAARTVETRHRVRIAFAAA